MGVLREGKVAVNLIGNHIDIVPAANVSDAPQFLRRPDTAYRIMRAAQEEQPDVLLHDFAFKIRKINGVPAILIDQRAFHNFSVIIPNHAEERVIDRRLNQDTVAGFRQRSDRHGQGMPQTLENELNAGTIQFFCVDTVDRESFSDQTGDPVHRAAVQEQYYRYVVEEALPLICQHNGTGQLPVATGFSLGASHAAICFFRRPELFSGVLGLSGCYDSVHFWNGWCNGTLYDNSPVHFLANPIDCIERQIAYTAY